ncbi:MAG: hypothetical protein JWR21_731 [Herminiimonas sp.]|nr:hypothetical protein [Herminiimonas sp.]
MNAPLISTGIYTIQDASRLLEVSSARLRGWVGGYRGMATAPLIKSDITTFDNKTVISFANLVEARFIATFARYGVNVRSIRFMVEEAKRVVAHPHPFSTDMIFKTDGKKIFMQAADKTGDPKLYDLKKKNFAIHDVLAAEFKKGVIYRPGGDAEAWYPRKQSEPNVILNPKMAFGQPVIEKYGVPTKALFDAFNAEDGSYESVAYWFDIAEADVKEAVRFEVSLPSAHENRV